MGVWPPRLSLRTSAQCPASGSLRCPPIMDTPASADSTDTTDSASATTDGLALATTETMDLMASTPPSTTEVTPDMEDTDFRTTARKSADDGYRYKIYLPIACDGLLHSNHLVLFIL